MKIAKASSIHYSYEDDGDSILTATDFDFDNELINSTAYRRAFISAQRKGGDKVEKLEKVETNSSRRRTEKSGSFGGLFKSHRKSNIDTASSVKASHTSTTRRPSTRLVKEIPQGNFYSLSTIADK